MECLFCILLLSLSRIFLRMTHVAELMFIPFYCRVVFYCRNLPSLLISSIDGHLGCFHLGAIMEKVAMNIFIWLLLYLFFHISWISS